MGAVSVRATEYDYKLFQYSTSVMESSVAKFTANNPGWEIVSMTSLSFQDQGSVSILLLARKEVAPPAPHVTPVSVLVVPTVVPNRVSVAEAPVWAKSDGYADAAAAAINAKLTTTPANGPAAKISATLDVVIDSTGTVQYASTRGDKVPKALADAAIAAVNAVGSFGAIPTGVNASQLADRSFTFSVHP